MRAPLRVAGGRDHARLVQEHVREALLRHRLPVDLDGVGRLHERVQLPRLAVDEHAAGLDQLVRLPARGHARACQVCVEPHFCSRPPPTPTVLRMLSRTSADLAVGSRASAGPDPGVTAYHGMEEVTYAVARAGDKRGARRTVRRSGWTLSSSGAARARRREQRPTSCRRGSSSGCSGLRRARRPRRSPDQRRGLRRPRPPGMGL